MARSVFGSAHTAAAAAILTALAALAAATGAAAYALQQVAATVAAAFLLAGAASGAAYTLWRIYVRPAEHGTRMLAEVAAEAPVGASLEAIAAAVRERVEHLERSQQRMHAVINDLPQGVLVFDRDGSLAEVNPTGAVMLGAVRDAGTGRAGGDSGNGAGGPAVAAVALVVEEHGLAAVAEQALRGERAEVDVPIEDEARWLQAQSQPYAAGDGELGAIVVLHDVTHLRHLEQVRRDFVANVSHELLTPITSVGGFVETLLDGNMCSGRDARHFLEIIHQQSVRMSAIVEDLLRLAHIEHGEERSSIAFEESALSPVITAAMLPCARAAAERGITLQETCDSGLTCRMNAALIEQAITNLIDNAIKYSSRHARVTVCGERRAGSVVIEVVDTGPGIAEEHQQRVFERFYRVDPARSRESGGTGLGLAIVKHIAQAHAGEVNLRSAPGHGCTFTLRLPG